MEGSMSGRIHACMNEYVGKWVNGCVWLKDKFPTGFYKQTSHFQMSYGNTADVIVSIKKAQYSFYGTPHNGE